MACDKRKQDEFGMGSNADEEIVHICTRNTKHSGRHHDQHTNYAWDKGGR